ncbi:MAG: Cellulose synthase catalytic subunit [UDP-forming] [Chroococcidiopsis sp. SAG 2025]|uniref:glycosyltransferase family 2 protein n=1 Tax=Chroococcidiopsis sp. SAG 2025 TaxID=171389 RepID=UPI0029371CE6|nr:glycosyltransferase [Chroococcidiopsis sp. SAG 2025]MDV2993445.1 Cellulose synthase catalytic subunit [UDP-forming] [Chroococcidiopsis sp. SAG 2025]
MTVSQIKNQGIEQRELRRVRRSRLATLVMFSIVAFSSLIVGGWFAGEGTITSIFLQLQNFQNNPPVWLEVPMLSGEYLLAPTIVLLLIVMLVMRISPQPKRWSRQIVVAILLLLTIRYIIWRSLTTLNLATPLNGVFSLGLLFLEFLVLTSSTIQLFLMLNVKDRSREADRFAVDVLDGNFTPTIDILIPTYNEPNFILKRTIIGCQALEYPHKKIYLLDDTRRAEVKDLATELGCQYLTRSDNKHAKAGNLNHAIAKTKGELIVVFDADFVPTKNFLTRTVGFFQNEKIALIQTPQSFYNADPIARNLGLEDAVTPEEEVFYRQIQPIRDGADSVICAGTSFVVRRKALQAAGGFVTDSLSEDYFTGIRLSAQGYRLIYLDEKLSAGLAAENIAAHATQRIRWAQGTLQAFFIDANPLTIKGLRPLQRIAHLEGLLHWFTSISRVGFLFMPLAYSFLGVIPLRATATELLYFFLPYYLVQLSVFAWLNHRSRSALLSDIYSLVLCFPLALTVIQVMLRPFAKGFKVTPKGQQRDRFSFNWKLASPLIILFAVTAISLWRNLGMSMAKAEWATTVPLEIAQQIRGIGLGWLWSGYNLIMLGIAILILLDAPKPDVYDWFALRRTVRCNIQGENYWGVTTMISEVGAEIALTQKAIISAAEMQPVTLEIMEEGVELTGEIIRTGFQNEFPTVRVMFQQLSLSHHRRLVEMLFCRPGQWKRHNTPGEFKSILLILKILFRPRIIFDRNIDVNAIAVSQG